MKVIKEKVKKEGKKTVKK